MNFKRTRRFLVTLALLALSASAATAAQATAPATPSVDGLKPITPAVLARIEGLAAKLATAASVDARVVPAMRRVLGDEDRGLIKRAVAARVLARLGRGAEVTQILAGDATPAAPMLASLVAAAQASNTVVTIAHR